MSNYWILPVAFVDFLRGEDLEVVKVCNVDVVVSANDQNDLFNYFEILEQHGL